MYPRPYVLLLSALAGWVLRFAEAGRTSLQDGLGALAPEPEYKVKDSNVEKIGSDDDKAQRKWAAGKEPAWNGTGKEDGVQVWRVENFHVEAWPVDKYGQFHTGDAYIVLNTEKKEQRSEKLTHTIFFWLGSETTADEAGTAAYKAVELDAYFDGEPVQVRETQGAESAAFKALFGGRVRYLPGGVDSGFRHVEPNVHKAKMFMVHRFKGQNTVLTAPWDAKSFNNGDCFVLDGEKIVYIVHGLRASAFEKHKAALVAHGLADARPTVGTETLDIGSDGDFCGALGGIQPPMPGC